MGEDAKGDGKGIGEYNKINELVAMVQSLTEKFDQLQPETIIKTEERMPSRVKMEPGLIYDKDCIDLVSDDDDADPPQEDVYEPLPPVQPHPLKRLKKSMYTKPLPSLHPSTMQSNSAEPSPKRPRVKSSGQNHKKKAYSKTKQVRHGAFRNWCHGHARNGQGDKIREEILEATVDDPQELPAMLRLNGFAVLRNYDKVLRRVKIEASDDDYDGLSSTRAEWGSLFSTGNAPTAQQAAYHETGTFDGKRNKKPPADLVFEGCVINDSSYDFGINNSPNEVCPVTGKVPRMVMKSKSKAHTMYNKNYAGQMEDIIKGMFAGEDTPTRSSGCADPANWNMTQTIVWGGIDHQHPHCDQGKAACFQYEQMFPFVCIHGFGVHDFTMWLLPLNKKREYGFPYRFPKKSMLFMRGDFIHAGACSQESRSHLEFYPKAEAGWTKTSHPYWGTPERFAKWQENKDTFLVPDLRSFPFGYPSITKDDVNGNQIVTYPCRTTREFYPNIDDNPDPKSTTKRQLPQHEQPTMDRQAKLKRK
jgi:hypothetical protein